MQGSAAEFAGHDVGEPVLRGPHQHRFRSFLGQAHGVGQRSAIDLAAVGPGNRCQRADVLRDHPFGQRLAQCSPNSGFGVLRAGEIGHEFGPRIVGAGGHECIGDAGNRTQGAFDLGGFDLVAADLHCVVDPAHEVEHPVVIDTAEIARPIAAQSRVGGEPGIGLLGEMQVPVGETVCGDADLPDLTAPSELAVGENDIECLAEWGRTGGQESGRERIACSVLLACNRARFGGGVPVHDDRARARGRADGEHVPGVQRFAVGDDVFEGRHRIVGDHVDRRAPRVRRHAAYQRRRAVQGGQLVLRNPLNNIVGVGVTRVSAVYGCAAEDSGEDGVDASAETDRQGVPDPARRRKAE